MADETGGGTLLQTLPPPPALSISPFRDPPTQRQRFHVELKGERAVSWKKLLKTLPTPPHVEAPPGANPALEARLAPESAMIAKGPSSAPNRFSNVIEKIERLYQGVDSDEEPGEGVDDDQYNTDDSFIDDEDLDEYFAVDRAKTKHSGFFINKGKLENTNDSLPPPQPVPKKRKRKDVPGNALKPASITDVPKKIKSEVNHPAGEQLAPGLGTVNYGEVGVCIVNKQPETQAQGGDKATTVKDAGVPKAKGPVTIAGPSVSKLKLPAGRKNILSPSKMRFKQANKDTPKTSFKQLGVRDEKMVKKPNAVKTALEKSFEELKEAVVEFSSRPPTTAVSPETEVRSKRLPREVKLKLAKVARFAAKQGKVPDDCIERLMSILGHLMQLKTLKRNLKDMVETAFLAKQEKYGRFLSMKREFEEQIRSSISSIEKTQGQEPLDDFQPAPWKRYFRWDKATEDRVRELYEIYFEVTDLSVAGHSRKLYKELADIWPEGWMDKEGIKDAVFRSKERVRQRIREEFQAEKEKKCQEMKKKAAEEKKAAEKFDLNKRAVMNMSLTDVLPVHVPVGGASSKEVLPAAVHAGKSTAVRAPKVVWSSKEKHVQVPQQQQQQQQQVQVNRCLEVKQEEPEVFLYKFRKNKGAHEAAPPPPPVSLCVSAAACSDPAVFNDANFKQLSSSQQQVLPEMDRGFGA